MNELLNRFFKLMPDKMYINLKYYYRFKKRINWKNPQTYNEKLQWLKVYYHRKDLWKYVDKYEVKEIIGEIIGKDHIIPTLGVWNNFDEIDFDKLPDQFVLKCTHDSGSIVICKDKSSFDKEEAKKVLEKALKTESFWGGREYPYKFVKPRIIAEKFMEDAVEKELRDYKFFVFDGKARYMFIATDRENKEADTCFDFYDMDFNHLDLRHGHPNAKKEIKKPSNFDEMRVMAEKLGANFPHVRVDFYEVNGVTYFGEMTFYHHCGFMNFDPDKWDYEFGKCLKLPEKIV